MLLVHCHQEDWHRYLTSRGQGYGAKNWISLGLICKPFSPHVLCSSLSVLYSSRHDLQRTTCASKVWSTNCYSEESRAQRPCPHNSVARYKHVGFKLSSLLCLVGYCWPYRKALPDVSNGTANLRGRWASSVRRMREKWSQTSEFHDDKTERVIARDTHPRDLPHWGKIFQLPFSIWSQFPKEHTFYGPGKPSLGPFGNQLWFFSPDSINSF